jgi:hypothetical protein
LPPNYREPQRRKDEVDMKKDDRRPKRHRRSSALTAIGLLAIGAGASLAHMPEAQAYQVAITSGDEATLEQFLRDHPTSLYAPDIIGRLSFGAGKTDTALPQPVKLASNAGGNGGGQGGGNGNGHGGGNGNGHGGGNGDGHGGGNGGSGGGNGGGQGGGGNAGSGSDAGDSEAGDGPNNGHTNGGNGHFHGEDDTGRPDSFGGPGTPDIGPPGLSGY